MEGLLRYIHAAAVISLGALALWVVNDLWLPLMLLIGALVAIYILLGRKKKSG